jgi:ABC-2 type transport system ATP-binding protein
VTGEPRVVAEAVSKWFGRLVAVSDVSFDIGPGVTALLGPNGAGKSTMFRMLCGLARPSKGTVRVFGRDPRTEPGVARQIGLVPQQESVFEPLTAREFVRLAAKLHGVPQPDAAAAHALETVDLDPNDTRRLPTYSKGMRQRVKVAQAIVHDPPVLVLDEPLTGLDPRQRMEMVSLFRRLGAEGRCVIVSSHVLDEVERLGSQVLVMSQGRLAAAGDFRELRALMDDRPLRVRVRTDRPRELAAALLAEGPAVGVRLLGDDALELDTGDARALAHAIAPLARDRGARLLEVRSLDADLEGVFRYVVQR